MRLGVPIVNTYGARIAAIARTARDGAGFESLLAYGTSFAAAARHMAGLFHVVMRGEHPAGMPVERIAQPELMVNLAVTRVIGVMIPGDIVARASQVVE